jgi:peptidoglycan/LPS O-acetylase OafA/YrhL
MKSKTGEEKPEASPYARHLPQLDGIRGLAVLGVIASHLFPGNANSAISRAVAMLFTFGATGVDLFFVLSGFLITGILYDSLRDPHFFGKFYIRRVLRIFPLYYAVLIFYVAVGIVRGVSWHGELWSLAFYLQNTSLIAIPISLYTGPLPLSHFWSLAVEEQFYLVWPLLVYVARTRLNLLRICCASLFLCPLVRLCFWMHGAGYFAAHENTLCRADTLLAGAALALLIRGRLHDQVLRVAPWFTLCILATLALRPEAPTGGNNHPLFWPTFQLAFRYTLSAAGYAGLIGWSLASPIGRRLLEIRPLRSLGRYSYGLYVLHLILFSYLQSPLKTAIATHLTPNKGIDVVLAGCMTFFISLVAAYLSYHFYEKRFLRLKRFFDYQPQPNTIS